jgi:hypothetical protein
MWYQPLRFRGKRAVNSLIKIGDHICPFLCPSPAMSLGQCSTVEDTYAAAQKVSDLIFAAISNGQRGCESERSGSRDFHGHA